MRCDFNQHYTAVKSWAQAAQSAAWLDTVDIEAVERLETASAEDLFVAETSRPLVVGLFGGTGAGKSSLLNRLAGEALAAVGVERPTSKRATLYLHQSQPITSLHQNSPVMDTDIRYHTEESKRQIAWLDMPDIDSVEKPNRKLALAWLPYIDWLIYVTTPERYRDDVGWELIKKRRNRHHWLFVINHWDEAHDTQLAEFRADLESAGFIEPTVLRTSCVEEAGDDFDDLEETINNAVQRHGLAELQRVGTLAKFEELDAIRAMCLAKIGTKNQWALLNEEITGRIDHRLQLFKARLNSELEGVVQLYPEAPALWRANHKVPALAEPDLEQLIWSGYCDHLLANIATEVAAGVENESVAGRPLFLMLKDSLSSAKTTVLGEMNDGLRNALANPEVPIQRVLRKLTQFMTYALPLAIGLWVSYNVLTRYQQGLTGNTAFLGIDFAVHSGLLIALGWFIPFLLQRWLRPSPSGAARRGLRYGLAQAVDVVSSDLSQARNDLEQAWESLVKACPQPYQ